ncbi:membrane bound O-acyl transferase family-domain-containing protein [Mycena filopes]|nr:membrane bound O-acyl transferase family-domain-containing protein [Mycena filopes]
MLLSLFTWQPFPYADFTLYFALILTAVAIPPSGYRRLFFLPILVLTWRLIHDGEAGYITSTAWFSYLLIASDFILLTDVQRELHQVPSTDPRSTRVTTRNIEHAPFPVRLKWALQLLNSPRGVGWAHQPAATGVIPRSAAPPNTRTHFILYQLARLSAALLLFDLMNLHTRWNPATATRVGMVAAGWGWRAAGTGMWALGAGAGLVMGHAGAGIVSVALGMSAPQDWPPLFGGLADATSVRAFWARGWHQLLRRPLCAHARFVSGTILGMPDRSMASRCLQVCVAFLLSGALHYLGETMPMRRGPERSGSLVFFALQPVAIALETLVCKLTHRAGVRVPKTLGCVWVFGWFVVTLPIMQDPLIRAGEMDSRVGVTFVMGLWSGVWVLPPVGGTTTA